MTPLISKQINGDCDEAFAIGKSEKIYKQERKSEQEREKEGAKNYKTTNRINKGDKIKKRAALIMK